MSIKPQTSASCDYEGLFLTSIVVSKDLSVIFWGIVERGGWIINTNAKRIRWSWHNPVKGIEIFILVSLLILIFFPFSFFFFPPVGWSGWCSDVAAKTFWFWFCFLSFFFLPFYCVRLPEFAVCTDVVLKNVLNRDGRLSARACLYVCSCGCTCTCFSPPPCTAVKKSV